MNKSKIIRKEPCPVCRSKGLDKSGDNLAIYADGGKYCWGPCNKAIELSDEYKAKINSDKFELKEYIYPVTNFTKEDWEEKKLILGKNATDPKGFRGLKKNTCDTYRVFHEYSTTTGEVIKQYYPISKDNQFSGIKWRAVPKAFGVDGTNNGECNLFGQALFERSTSKWIVVASGELDALSAFQMLESQRKGDFASVPVVSGTIGETGSANQYRNNYAFLDKFEKIILIPDQDEAGQAAIERIAQSLPKDKLYIADLPAKDCNEMLMSGREKEFCTAVLWKHRHYSPAGIHGSDVIFDAILQKALTPKIPFPPFLSKLNHVTGGGIAAGAIVNILAASGVGKTSLINQCVLHWIKEGLNPGIVSLEADLGDYGENILGVHMKEKLQLLVDPNDKFNHISSMQEEAEKLFKSPEGKPTFYVIDDRGDYDQLQARIEQLIISCDSKIVVIDVLSDVFEGMSLDFQSSWMAWEKKICKRYGTILVNVVHARKAASGQKAGSRGAVLSEEDMSGSSSQFKSGSLNISLSRNKEADDDMLRNLVAVHLSKNRFTGITQNGIMHLSYDLKTHTLSDASVLFEQIKAKEESESDKKKYDRPLNSF